MNFGPKQESYIAHIDLPELHVHCKLTQIHTPRGTRILFLIRQLLLLREEFRLLKLIFHSELRRREASRRALPCQSSFLYVDQSSSRRLEKIGEDIPTCPKVIGAHTMNFRPDFEFLRLIFFLGGGPRHSWGVRYVTLVNL